MHVVAVQFDIAWEDRAANHAKVAALLERQPPPRDSVVVLPEMFASGFSMNVAKTAQDETRADERFVAALCRRFGVWCVAGVVSGGASREMGRNEAVAVGPQGQLVARYCKMHPFSLAGEDRCCERGADVATFDCAGFTLAPVICYDLRFPELFRILRLQGADVVVLPAAFTMTTGKDHWEVLIRARAIENQVYMVSCGQFGPDASGKWCYGRSLVADPWGTVLGTAPDREYVLKATVDLDYLQKVRRQVPSVENRQADLYRWPDEALVLG
jgi:predicted amidohydrolase